MNRYIFLQEVIYMHNDGISRSSLNCGTRKLPIDKDDLSLHTVRPQKARSNIPRELSHLWISPVVLVWVHGDRHIAVS